MRAASILAGTDYRTTAAALFDFGAPIGPVALTGAFGPGVADTVLTRLEDAILPAVGSSDTIAIQLRMLDLRGIAPAFIGGAFFDVFFHLDPNVPSTGSMTISHEFPDNGTPAAEGTFVSTLQLNYRANFVPTLGNTGASMSLTGSIARTTPGPLPWSHEPPPGVLIVPGPPGDRDANVHAPLPAGFSDFFPLLLIEQNPGIGIHVGQLAVQNCQNCELQAIIPEPATYLPVATGFGFLVLWFLIRRFCA
jgi:hypothetical protein